jgi:hypothetical protein
MEGFVVAGSVVVWFAVMAWVKYESEKARVSEIYYYGSAK